MIKRLPSVSIIAEVRRRLSRLSSERHTAHWQPITGTPCDVPVPRKLIFIATKIQNKTRKERQSQIFFQCPIVRHYCTPFRGYSPLAEGEMVGLFSCSSFFFPMKKNEQTLSAVELSRFQGCNDLYSLGELSLLRGVGWGSEG